MIENHSKNRQVSVVPSGHKGVLKVHKDFIFDRESDAQECFQNIEDSSWQSNILREGSGMPLLQKLGCFSPYRDIYGTTMGPFSRLLMPSNAGLIF
jgi:hypothetical protein